MISILMPIYNGIEFIEQSVTSVLNQTVSNWSLVIGINGHPPNSEVYKIAKQYEIKDKRIRIHDLPTNIKGKSHALNEMLNLCEPESKWICLLDVDDIWLPTKLQSQIPFMTKYDVIGTRCQYFGDLNTSPSLPTGDISKFDFLKVNPVVNSSCLLRRELCYWNGSWNGIEDYDLWLRLWKLGKKFYNVESVQVLHRIHKQSAFNANGNSSKVPQLIATYRA